LKLLNTKKWFTIDDTARYLSSKFDENVTQVDVLQFVVDDRLKLSWVLNNRPVIKVIKGEVLYLKAEDSIIYRETGEIPDVYKDRQNRCDKNYFFNIYTDQDTISEDFAKQTFISKSIRTVGKLFYVTGAFNFDMSEGAIDSSILSLVTQDDHQWFSFDGFVLINDHDGLIQPVDIIRNTGKEDFLTNSVNHYPTDRPPLISELVIKREDLSQFEDYLISNSNSRQVSLSAEISYLKIIGALVALLKTERARKYTQGNIQDYLETRYHEELGIKSFSKSNLEKIFSKANETLKDN
jgi:hypothetical protein